jgi:glycosyltransferase involved in cell wall biosynthesis
VSTAVSAIIPAYNCGPFLGAAIASALAQEGVDREVIVVDDGSTDDTPAVIASYGERIRAIRQQNLGLSAARNAGIRAARGWAIGFLDADDTWEPAKSRKQLDYLEAHPACGLVFSDVVRMSEAGRRLAPILGERWAEVPTGNCLERLFLGNFVLVPGAMVRRTVLASVGPFDETLRSVEDYDMWLRIAEVAEIGFLPEPLASWRERAGQMSRNRDRMVEHEARVLEAALARRPDLRRTLGRRVRRRFARLQDENGWYDLSEGRLRPALVKFLRALRHDPTWGKPYRHLVATALAAAGRRSPSS